jgi:two-component system OmpR family sensor kinase
MSIRLRITLFGLGVVSLVLGLFCAAVYLLLAASVTTTQDTTLTQRVERAAATLSEAPPAASGPVPAAIDLRSSSDVFVMVLDGTGRPLHSTGSVDGGFPAIPPGALLTTASTVDVGPGLTVRLHVQKIRGGYVLAGQPTRKVKEDRRGIFALVLVYAVLGFGAAAGAIWLVTGRALRPLRQLTMLVDDVGRAGDLTRRLPPVTTRDDVGRLTGSFNTMMERLERSFAAQRRFVADASHELRTPLTTIRSNSGFLLHHPEAAEDDRQAALRDIAGESARMHRLVEQLLTLAGADAPPPAADAFGPVDLAELTADIGRQARTLHPGRQIHCPVTPVPPVIGDPHMLSQLVWILLDNAVKFSADGGNVWMTVTQRGDRAQLSVSDDGTGIRPGDERRIFERFYRADDARTGGGAGLGLSIGLSIVQMHAGTVVVANNATGGASFVADLPLFSSTS